MTCRRCGGGGMLRLADQRYRTCLECLGQGRLNPVQVQPAAVADLHPLAPALAVNLSAVSSAR